VEHHRVVRVVRREEGDDVPAAEAALAERRGEAVDRTLELPELSRPDGPSMTAVDPTCSPRSEKRNSGSPTSEMSTSGYGLRTIIVSNSSTSRARNRQETVPEGKEGV